MMFTVLGSKQQSCLIWLVLLRMQEAQEIQRLPVLEVLEARAEATGGGARTTSWTGGGGADVGCCT